MFLNNIKQIYSMLPCGRENVVRTIVTHWAIASCATFLYSVFDTYPCAIVDFKSSGPGSRAKHFTLCVLLSIQA